MLSALCIRNFRGVEALDIERVGRVSLLVGANNVGKSTVLEALDLHRTPTEEAAVAALELLDRRHDLRRPGLNLMGQARALFFDGQSDRPLCIGQAEDHPEALHIATGWFHGGDTPEGRARDAEGSRDHRPSPTAQPALLARRGAVQDWLVFSEGAYIPRWRERRALAVGPASRGTALWTDGLSVDEMNRMWDLVALNDQEDEVVAALQLIEPDIDRVLLVRPPEEHALWRRHDEWRLPFVRRRAPGRGASTVPLKGLGDGMNRLFGLILGLVAARGGLFLLDEAESGLHYLVLDDLWRMVFELSRRLEVQVVATTHSADCLGAFARVALEDEAQGQVVRLLRDEGALYARIYDEDALAVVSRHRLEIR